MAREVCRVWRRGQTLALLRPDGLTDESGRAAARRSQAGGTIHARF